MMIVMVFKSEAAKYCFSHPNLIKQGRSIGIPRPAEQHSRLPPDSDFRKLELQPTNIGELKDWSRHILDEKVLQAAFDDKNLYLKSIACFEM